MEKYVKPQSHMEDPNNTTKTDSMGGPPTASVVSITSVDVLQPGEVSAVSWQCGGGPHKEDMALHMPAYSRPMNLTEIR